MSPEQITGRHTDARTDIYALGCVFFQMVAGRVPYERETSLATMFAHVHDPPPRIGGDLCERYPTLGAVVEKATAKEPDDRYISAGDFARDAAAALTGARYSGPPTMVATGEATPVPKHEIEPSEAGAVTEPDPSTEPGTRLDSAAAAIRKSALPPEIATQPGSSPTGPRHLRASRRRLGRYGWALLVGLVCLAVGVPVWLALSSSSPSANKNVSGAAMSPKCRRTA